MVKILLATTAILALFSGCNDSIDSASHTETPAGFPDIDLAKSKIPYPNNILFAGSDDGTLNIPYDPSSSDAGIKQALNTLDGFSTTAPIALGITGNIVDDVDPSTFASGIHIYQVSEAANVSGIPVTGAIEAKLAYGYDYAVSIQKSGEAQGTLAIIPLRPLMPSKNYAVIITKDLKDTDGRSMQSDTTTALLNGTDPIADAEGNPNFYFDDPSKAGTLENLRKLNQAMFAAMTLNETARDENGCSTANYTAFSCDNVVLGWNFKTQSIGKVAQAFSNADTAGMIVAQDTNLSSKEILALAGYEVSAMQGNAAVYSGVLGGVPYYLHDANSSHDTSPRNYFFEMEAGSDLPKVQSTQTIPLLITVPKTGTTPSAGWPVVIFQHGITSDRTALLPISEAFASIGYAAVAIDLPLHGLTSASPLQMPDYERTFNLDLLNNATGAAGPDGVPDTSGSHYINLENPLISRDNIRQTTSDLITLLNSLGTATNIGLDASKVAFVGHSLGSMAPQAFLAHRPMESVTLAMPGSGIAELLNNSKTFGPIIQAGLAANGIQKGSAEYASFMIATQTMVDDGDPANYAAAVSTTQNHIYAIEVNDDAVIPNSVATAPLSGTEPLLRLLDADKMTQTGSISTNAYVKFSEGDHSSILSPASSLAATVEMQTQTATFIYSQGTQLLVSNPSVIAQ